MSTSSRPRLLFVCLGFTSFVEDDLALLREHYDVRVFHFDADAPTAAGRTLKLLAETLRQFAWLLRELPKADLVYGWFADYHLALPTLLARSIGVPSVVMLGGFDCNHLPALGYGVWSSRWRVPIARRVFRHATLLLAGACSHLQSETRYPTWPEQHVDGLYVHVPQLRTPCRIVPLGFQAADWPLGPLEREPVVVTVAYVNSERDVQVKGIDLLIAAARHLPEVTFQVIGIGENFVDTIRTRYKPPANVQLHPSRPREALPAVYAAASVYAQLSRVESFGCALAEAMLSGCVPVTSDVGGLPAVVGEAGGQVLRPHPEEIAAVLRQALGAGPAARTEARARIEQCFALHRREDRLMKVLEAVRP